MTVSQFTRKDLCPTSPYVHETGIARIRDDEYRFEMSMTFVSEAERDAALALFPKYAKVYATTISGYEVGTHPTIGMQVGLRADGVNGGVNETGLKRANAVKKAIAKAGIPTAGTDFPQR